MGSPHRIPDVVGSEQLVAKQSAVNEQGKLRAVPIDGVIFRPARPVPHEDGHVTEVARASWKELSIRSYRFISRPPCRDACAPGDCIKAAPTVCSW